METAEGQRERKKGEGKEVRNGRGPERDECVESVERRRWVEEGSGRCDG